MSLLEAEPARTRNRSWGALVPVLLFLVAVGITVAIALLDHVTVESHSGLKDIGFGLPLAWLRQDQSALPPPFPMDATPISPWEYPASVSWVPFILDVLMVFAVLLAVWLACRALTRSLKRHSTVATTTGGKSSL